MWTSTNNLRQNIIIYILDYFGISYFENINLNFLNELCIAALLKNDDLISIIVSEFYYDDNDILDLDVTTTKYDLIPLNTNTFPGLFYSIKDIHQLYEQGDNIINLVLIPLIKWIEIIKPSNKYNLIDLCKTYYSNYPMNTQIIDNMNNKCSDNKYINNLADILYKYLFIDNGLDNNGDIELNIGSAIPVLNLHQPAGNVENIANNFTYSYNELAILSNDLKTILYEKNIHHQNYNYAEYLAIFSENKILLPLLTSRPDLSQIDALNALYGTCLSVLNKEDRINFKNSKYYINDLLEICLEVAITNTTNVNVARIYLLGEKIGQYMKDHDILINDLNNAVYMLSGKDNENVELFKFLSVNLDSEKIKLLLDNFKRDEELQKQIFYVIANTPKPNPIPDYFENIYNAYDAWIANEQAINDARKTEKNNREEEIQEKLEQVKGGSRWGRKQRIKITPLKSKSKSKTKKHMRHRHRTLRKQKQQQKSKHRKSIARNTKQRKHTIRQNIEDSDSILLRAVVMRSIVEGE